MNTMENLLADAQKVKQGLNYLGYVDQEDVARYVWDGLEDEVDDACMKQAMAMLGEYEAEKRIEEECGLPTVHSAVYAPFKEQLESDDIQTLFQCYKTEMAEWKKTELLKKQRALLLAWCPMMQKSVAYAKSNDEIARNIAKTTTLTLDIANGDWQVKMINLQPGVSTKVRIEVTDRNGAAVNGGKLTFRPAAENGGFERFDIALDQKGSGWLDLKAFSKGGQYNLDALPQVEYFEPL